MKLHLPHTVSDLNRAQINYIPPSGFNDYTDALHFRIIIIIIIIIIIMIITIIIIIQKRS